MAGKCSNCELCLSHSRIGAGNAEKNEKNYETKIISGEEIIFSPGIELNRLEYDEGKQIELIDNENRVIQITFSKAKPIFGEAVVLKKSNDSTYFIDVVFNKKCFGDSNYLIIK